MAKTTLASRIEEIIEPTVAAMGFGIVRIQFSGQHSPRLQVMAERRDGAPMHVDDCAELSRTISALLDVEDPISGTYTLEVSSPGIDRPLVRLADFGRFVGFKARIEMGRSIDGRRRFKGRLAGTDGETVKLDLGGDTVALPYADIQRAKLLLTDDLLAADAPSDRKQTERT